MNIMILKGCFCSLAFLFFAYLGAAQERIDPMVMQKLSEENAVNVLIVFSQNADLSPSVYLNTKLEKGEFVYSKLKEISSLSQDRVAEYLRHKNIQFRSFCIVNAISTRIDVNMLQDLVLLDEIKEIVYDAPVTIPKATSQVENIDFRGGGIEWGVQKINADDVWAMGMTGTGIVVGGSDTGYQWDHPALKDQYRGWDGVTADHDYSWHDAIQSRLTGGTNICGVSSPFPCDDISHGTHTMGTMVGDDGGGNQIGVAPGAKWIGCRCFDNGAGTISTMVECYQWFLAPWPVGDMTMTGDASMAPHVINNSWACTPPACTVAPFGIIETSVQNLRDAGVVVVAAAGNAGSDCTTIFNPPSLFEETISVGSIDITDAIASNSSRGPVFNETPGRIKPDVTAPGVDVRSSVLAGAYGLKSGTSMAAPHTVGAVALILDAVPSLIGQVTDIETILYNSAVGTTSTQSCGGISGSSIPNYTFGHGIIDAKAAVTAAIATLPIELISFSAMAKDDHVLLNWSTASEINNRVFIIERSINSTDWEKLDSLNGQRYSSGVLHYAYIDEYPMNGNSYYRLRQVDYDGAKTYSNIESVSISNKEKQIRVYPSPTTGKFTVEMNNDNPFNISIYNTQGQLVQEILSKSLLVNLELPNGLFFLKIIQDANVIYHNKILVY